MTILALTYDHPADDVDGSWVSAFDDENGAAHRPANGFPTALVRCEALDVSVERFKGPGRHIECDINVNDRSAVHETAFPSVHVVRARTFNDGVIQEVRVTHGRKRVVDSKVVGRLRDITSDRKVSVNNSLT